MRDPLSEAEPAALTAPVRVLGIGSPYGDDRAGWAVLEHLALDPRWAALPPGTAALGRTRPDAGLLERLDGAELGIVVDALEGADVCGTVLRIADLDSLETTRGWSSHGVGLADLLRLGASLDQLPRRWCVYGIAVEPRPCGPEELESSLSRPVAEAVERAARVIMDEVRQYLGTRD